MAEGSVGGRDAASDKPAAASTKQEKQEQEGGQQQQEGEETEETGDDDEEDDDALNLGPVQLPWLCNYKKVKRRLVDFMRSLPTAGDADLLEGGGGGGRAGGSRGAECAGTSRHR